jgi:HEPN domain-containing protein
MKNETERWLQYADENYESAKVLLESHLYNPCLQNIQQCVEKALKAIFIERNLSLKRSHDIYELYSHLTNEGIEIELTVDECEFLNSIYLPSKYPIGSALPDFDPDESVCQEALTIAEKVLTSVKYHL